MNVFAEIPTTTEFFERPFVLNINVFPDVERSAGLFVALQNVKQFLSYEKYLNENEI